MDEEKVIISSQCSVMLLYMSNKYECFIGADVSGKCDYCYKIRIWQLNIKHMVVYIFVLGYDLSMIMQYYSE